MAYRIAVGSSDGTNVDLKFGEVEKFIIFAVEGVSCKLLEIRQVANTANPSDEAGCASGACSSSGCGSSGGCSRFLDVTGKVDLIDDCRCIVCKKIGFQAQKQLERKAISVFDIEGDIGEILGKIAAYYDKLDNRRVRQQTGS